MSPESSTTLDQYLELITTDSDEQRFLRSMPWVLDSHPQNHDVLLKSLEQEARRLESLSRRPVFTLLTPMYNTPARLLRELILSMRAQTYPHWELILVDDGSPNPSHLGTAREWADRDARIKVHACEQNRGISGARNYAIEHSSGEFLAILDHDDVLHPMALGFYARALNENPDLNFLFSNECQLNDETMTTYGFFYKPMLDLFTLLRANYVCHFTAIRRDLLLAARRGDRVFRSEYDGAEDHDLFARVAMTGLVKSHHVPLFLYLWRAVPTSCSMSLDAKPEIPQRRMRLLADLLPQIYPGATFEFANHDESRGQCHLTIRIKSLDLPSRPNLLVAIPLPEDFAALRTCLDGLEAQEHELNVRVVIAVSPESQDQILADLAGWMGSPRQHTYEIVEAQAPGFPSRTVNAMVREHGSDDDLVLLLRPDTELKTSHGLQTLAMQLLADRQAAFVGVKIAETDPRLVRSAGIKISEWTDGAGYQQIGSVRNYRDYVDDEHAILGVSLRCAMVRREIFLALGGLDEVALTHAYADLDLCARAIEHGYRNFYFGTVLAMEHSPDGGIIAEDREYERTILWERHARTLSQWRLRMLAHSYHPIWPMAAPVPPFNPADQALPLELPTRYKVADKLNSGLKRALGPLHGVVKTGVHRSWRMAKRLRRPVTAMKTIYRPHLRSRSVDSSETMIKP